jgi:alkanesulfonate monooxygenase SsuD/methylene tetrahydromethanopterin reductase-like flavin-dependent oxidoreductase (luciferase family)
MQSIQGKSFPLKVGLATICQNPDRRIADYEVYKNELRLADLAEPLGFDSIWSVEHHFTDYTMVPDVLQFLTYMAGRTKRINLGSMVVVLPWHDPMRVAEQVAMLDDMCDGRLILGLGRGAGEVEFEGFRVPMGESRERFVEATEMILTGLEQGYCEYNGKFYTQPHKDIRPAPFKSFKGRTYAAAVSPESAEIMARLGLGILIIPQKPWEAVASELDMYRGVYRQIHGVDAPPTIAGGWVFCDRDEKRAREMARLYIGNYWKSAVKHYNFTGEHFAKTKGYEYYGKMAEQVSKAGIDGVTDFFLNLQVWGTPEQCVEKVYDIQSKVGCDAFTGVFCYGGMPYDEAERNIRLFASEVMPRLQQVDQRAVAL